MINKNANVLMGILITLGIIILIGLIFFGWVAGTYNSLVSLDTNVQQKFGNVQTALQRQADLIPNLVTTVKAYSKYEGDTQTKIAEIRSGIRSATTPGQLDAAGKQMNSLISNLIVSVEAYPDLKANENYLALQDELAGSINRVTWERNNYNEAVKEYATKIRTFPANIIASMFGFNLDKWQTFQANKESQNTPEVKF
jgi:LemA protein